MLKKLRYISSTAAVYLLTVGVLGYMLSPIADQLLSTPVHAEAIPAKKPPRKPEKPRFVVVSGLPTRIAIPDLGINLAVDIGTYNPANGSWTLSNTNAQFANFTALANNHTGNTFIYGHATSAVFGALAATVPPVGTVAKIYTDNGVFLYTFTSAKTLAPNDTHIFKESTSGSSRLTIQTCTGVFSEWRTMYEFDFIKVQKQ